MRIHILIFKKIYTVSYNHSTSLAGTATYRQLHAGLNRRRFGQSGDLRCHHLERSVHRCRPECGHGHQPYLPAGGDTVRYGHILPASGRQRQSGYEEALETNDQQQHG